MIQWAAGLIDGEGCISIAKQARKDRPTAAYHLRITVTMVHLPTLERLQKIIGGNIHVKRSYQNHRTAWVLTIYDKKALKALLRLIPHLVTKREEAEAALDFGSWNYTTYPKGGVPKELVMQRETLYRRLQELKRYEFPESPARLQVLQKANQDGRRKTRS